MTKVAKEKAKEKYEELMEEAHAKYSEALDIHKTLKEVEEAVGKLDDEVEQLDPIQLAFLSSVAQSAKKAIDDAIARGEA